MKSLPIKLKLYLFFIYIAAPFSIYLLSNQNYSYSANINFGHIIFFILLSAITESFAVAYRNLTFSPTFAITFASFIIFGPLPTILVLSLGFSFRIVKPQGKYIHIFNTPFYKTLFNTCMFSMSVTYSSFLFILALNVTNNNIIGYITFAVFFFIFNTLFVSILKSILVNQRLFSIFGQNFRLGALNILIMAPFGQILVLVYRNSIWGVILFIFPILLARYTFFLYIEVKSKYIQTVDILMRAIEARDNYTEGHSHRVASIVEMIARELKYNESKIEQLNIASLLHDVGKIGIDDSILNKPGELAQDEYEIIKKHPTIGYNILKDIKDFRDISFLVKHHHERYDGKGYPDGRNSENLNLDVFIIQLADAIDAMATNRPYRPALNNADIIEELRKNSGTQFHPVVVDAYLKTQLRKS